MFSYRKEIGMVVPGGMIMVFLQVSSLPGLFRRVPIQTPWEVCNGGDGAIDIYIDRMSKNYKGLTLAYPLGCSERPTWMWISPRCHRRPEYRAGYLRHEFTHMIGFVYGKGGDCDDYAWLAEAAGPGAIDYVYLDDQFG